MLMQVRTYLNRALFAAGFLFVSACGHGGKGGPNATATPTPQPVQVSTAYAGVLKPTERLAGVAAPFQNVAISSTLTEPADAVKVQEGDIVHAGEVIAVLDTADLVATLNADLATARSDAENTTHTIDQGGLNISQGVDTYRSALDAVAQAQATLGKDRTDLNRYVPLLRNGYITAQTVQQQQTLVLNDEKALQAAQASAASAKSAMVANGTLTTQGLQGSSIAQSRAEEQVALAQAQQERVLIAKATIVSPIDGVVVNRNINPGEYPGTRQIFTLQQIDPVYVVLHGSSSQVEHVPPGARVSFASPIPGHSAMNGRVVGVLDQINPGSTDFQVKAVVANPAGMLRPGVAVEAEVALAPLRGVIVPTTAFTDDRQSNVMVLTPDHKAKLVRVTALGTAGALATVAGLPAGTRVITNGQLGVAPGQAVAVR
jgi:RND family efflux transporter MFP subunit